MAIGQKVADIYTKFGLDDNQFKKGLREANKNIKGTKTNIFDLEKSFKLAWAAMSAAVIAGATRISMESIRLASDMQELDNVINKTFGSAANSVRAYADVYAKAAGRSSLATRELTSFYGQMLKTQGLTVDETIKMSQAMTQLTFDMGSFKNISDERARFALKGIITGETESLKEQGIVMTQLNLEHFAMQKNLGKTYKEMSALEQLQTRYNFVLESTSFFHNDAVDTIKSTANQTKLLSANMTELKTSLGFLLEPKYNKALRLVNDVLGNWVDSAREARKELDLLSQQALKDFQIINRDISLGLNINQTEYKKVEKLLKQYEDVLEARGIDTKGFMKDFQIAFSRAEFDFETGKRDISAAQKLWEEFAIEAATVLDDSLGGTIARQEAIEAGNKAEMKQIDERNKLLETQKEIAMQNAEAIKKSIEAEIEKQRIEKEAQENRAKNIELDKQIYKSENDLKNTQRELQLREINQINQLKNAFQGLSETKAEEKFAELENNLIGNQEALILLNLVFEDYINSIVKGTDDVLTAEDKLKNWSNSMSDTAKIIEDLSEIFDNDLLPVLSNTISTISSSLMSLSTGGLGAVSGAIGLIGAGLAVYNYITDDSDLIESQKEADENFSKAVDDFRRAVNEFSIGQQISYAQLQRPTNLSNLASISNRDIQGIDLGIYGEFDPTKYLLRQIGGGTTQDLDVSRLQQALNESGYGDINARAIFEKFATRDTVRTGFLGLDKEEVVTYDEAKAIAEINKLIEEAYRLNLDNFKNAVGLTEQAFSSALISAFKNGGDVEQAITEVMKNAMITAVFSAEAFSQVSSLLGDKISEKLFESLDISVGDLENMGIEDLTNLLISLFGEGAEFLNEMFEELGWNVDSVNKEFQQLTGSTQNLPSGLKTATAGFTAQNQYQSAPQIIIQGDVYDNIAFNDKVLNVMNRDIWKATGVMRGGY